ncbi:hypothetical protein HYX11_00405 [Candidatus Woesearchaeota archaeon]|nr:hypothetical protein [Candidatus Woesearchaeota archaeon]
MTLENLTGNLLHAYKQSVKGKNRHVDQLMTERRTNKELRTQWFYTADGEVYSVDNGTPTLRITREATNPVFNHLEDDVDNSYEQLVTKGNYQVLPADFEAVKSAVDTVTIDLTQLTLQGDYKEWRYVSIPTKKPSVTNKSYDKLNTEERKLAKRIYGQGTDFVENMQMLEDAGITETRIYVLNPQYVQEHAKKNAVVRASWLYDFYDYSSFNADDRSIDIDGRLRGVRREVSEGDVAKNGQVPSAPSAPQEIKYPTVEDILSTARQYVPECAWDNFQTDVRNLYKQ